MKVEHVPFDDLVFDWIKESIVTGREIDWDRLKRWRGWASWFPGDDSIMGSEHTFDWKCRYWNLTQKCEMNSRDALFQMLEEYMDSYDPPVKGNEL